MRFGCPDRIAIAPGESSSVRRVQEVPEDAPLVGAIALPDGTLVRGRGRREVIPAGPLPEYGLYLGHPPDVHRRTLLRRRAPWRPGWPADWVDWPDFRTPRDPADAAAKIVQAYRMARAGTRVEIACTGGTGRTGTVIACMAVLAGHPAADAVAWTRHQYRPRAVETRGQRRWIAWFAAAATV
jgi:Protein-tyrosine phosphatase